MLRRHLTRYAVVCCGALLLAGAIAPYISARRFGEAIRAALQTALERKVEIGDVHFDLFTGPGFSIERVIIHDDPALSAEPVAYVASLEAVPRLLPLLRGRLELASIRLEDASINLAKSGPASETGRWNFERLLNRPLPRALPEIHIRSSRINFKFGDAKSVFYFMNTDLDISPPSRWRREWGIEFSGEPARTDRPARGFGSFRATGAWLRADAGEARLNLHVELARSNISDIIALLHGRPAGIHGSVSSRMYLAGPLRNVHIAGQVRIEDVHRWDVLPPSGEGWPLNLEGRLDLIGQRLELVSSSSGRQTVPLTVRFRASDYLYQPHWGLSVNWNRFPVEPLLAVARHMGAAIPPDLRITGSLEGAIGCEDGAKLQGELAFHDTAVAMPGSPSMRFEQARLLFDQGHAHLTPAVVHLSDEDHAQITADYHWDSQSFDLSVATDSMRVGVLKEEVALAAIPWLGQMEQGIWHGQLTYHCGPEKTPCMDNSGWEGRIQLTDARLPLPGIADPLELDSANVLIRGERIALARMRARAGDLALQGEYSYDPRLERPHRLRLMLPEADAAELERLLAPGLRRTRGLIARAFSWGKAPVPDWLRTRRLEGSVEIGSLAIAGQALRNLRSQLTWDGTRVKLDKLQAAWEESRLTGTLSVSLRGSTPTYLFAGRLSNAEWRSGTLDLEGVLETAGTGADLLGNMRSSGWFSGRDLELESPLLRQVSGVFRFRWQAPFPSLAFSDLQFPAGQEVYTGSGATQPDGRLLILLSSGEKEMRVTGTLARLQVDEAGGQ